MTNTPEVAARRTLVDWLKAYLVGPHNGESNEREQSIRSQRVGRFHDYNRDQQTHDRDQRHGNGSPQIPS